MEDFSTRLSSGSYFNARAKELEDYVIQLRRDFHMHPEVAYRETRTSERVREE